MVTIHAYLWGISVFSQYSYIVAAPLPEFLIQGPQILHLLLKVSWTSEPCIELFSQVCMYCCFISFMALPMWSQGVIIVHLSHSLIALYMLYTHCILLQDKSPAAKDVLCNVQIKLTGLFLRKKIFKSRECSSYN